MNFNHKQGYPQIQCQKTLTYFIAVVIRSDLILDSNESNVTVQST